MRHKDLTFAAMLLIARTEDERFTTNTTTPAHSFHSKSIDAP
jgi:hypothetical protein